MTFETFMTEVETIFQAKIGMSYLDMPDWCYMDSYEDGLTPLETYEDWAAEYWPEGD